MSNEGDMANELVEHYTKLAVENRERFEGPSEKECIVCHEEIPQARRDKLGGVKRCVYCQSEFEKKNRNRSR